MSARRLAPADVQPVSVMAGASASPRVLDMVSVEVSR